MKLSDLIDFKNQLNALPVSAAKEVADQKLDQIAYTVSLPPDLPEDLVSELATTRENIHQAFNDYSTSIDRLKAHIKEKITEEERQWFQDSYKLFEVTMFGESNEQILNRRLSKTGENSKVSSFQSESILRARLSSYADWRFSGLIIRPGLENFIESMVGYDPLYIVDQNLELLKPCLEQFPKLYQSRLRPYTMDDRSDDPILGKIPNDQFGLCLVYNFFNYRPLEIIRRYLHELYEKLRPGGILLMTFNDCDQSNAVKLVEKNFACYTPGYLIRELANNIGFEQTHTWGDGGPSVWLELRKPGKLDSLRGGQTMAKIRDPIEIEDDVDFLARKVYTIDEVERLRNQARDLGAKEAEYMQLKPLDLQKFVSVFRAQKIKEQIKREEAAEKQRVFELYELARSFGIDPLSCPNEEEINRQIYEARNTIKKQELVLLRQRAMELRVGDPNLVRYGYSAEKLKQLIKEKEEGQ